MSNQYDVAVVGATGAVGEAMISILQERDFPVRKLYPLASSRSAASRKLVVESVAEDGGSIETAKSLAEKTDSDAVSIMTG